MDLQAVSRAASEAAAQIDARVKTRLAELARKLGMTEAEEITLAAVLFRMPCRALQRLPLGDLRKGH